jgi:hypothetical protein
MVHGDNKGLVLPPRVASVQVVVVPVGITVKSSADERTAINEACQGLADKLKSGGVRSKADLRENYTPGYKFNHWELRVKFYFNKRVSHFGMKSDPRILLRMRLDQCEEIQVNFAKSHLME